MNIIKRIKFALTPKHMRRWTVRRVLADGTIEVPTVPPVTVLSVAGYAWNSLAEFSNEHGWLMPQEWAEMWAFGAAPPWTKLRNVRYITIRIK